MTSEGLLDFSVVSMIDDVIQQHGRRLSDIDFASRKANETSLRRFEAAGWLRKMVGVVGGKDLPAQPTEDEFRLGLRSGIILCNVLNKLQPGAVPKVVEAPYDTVIIPDGAALSVYQYFENVRNFLVAVERMGIPTFEASDLEQGGKSSRLVNCVLALKSFSDWKENGGHGVWKYGGNLKPSSNGKQFVRRNSDAFMNCFPKNLYSEDHERRNSDAFMNCFPKNLYSEDHERRKSDAFMNCFPKNLYTEDHEHDLSGMDGSRPYHSLVRKFLFDKRQEEIPIIMENLLSKVTEEFERRLATQNQQMKITATALDASCTTNTLPCSSLREMKMEDAEMSKLLKFGYSSEKEVLDDEVNSKFGKQHVLFQKQNKDLQDLKHTVSTARMDVQLLQKTYQEEINCLGQHLHSLAHAASGYQKVLEENRKLYNQVQDLKGSIRVYCRVRPFLPGQPNRLSTLSSIDNGKITLITPSKNGKDGRKSFTYNQVFGPSATQEEVFSDMQPLIRSVLDGYNVCIFAYGQTGSGKTYTMSGPNDLTEETLGVNYRALSDLFSISEQRKDIIHYDVSVQMLEIYNEQVRDLLVTDGLHKRLEIRNSSQNGMNVPDANLVPVASTSDVMYLMNLGLKNRAVGSTAMNDRSSRSHSCLTVHVQGRDLTSGTVLRGCMHLVDLAGSERVDKSEAVGDRLKEAQHINKSLSALGDVISSLAQKNAHVPYRNSKLTQLLQDALGGQAKTLMFVHISPETDAISETISTLKFAERVSTVELGAARANKDSAEVKELKEQIASLKAALANKAGESVQQTKLVRMMSAGSTISNSSWQSVGNMSDNCRLRMEDVGNVEVNGNQKKGLRRNTLDPRDLLAGSTNWVNEDMVNKPNGASMNETTLERQWEDDVHQFPKLSCPKYVPDPSKIYPEQPINKNDILDHDINRIRYEVATTDESDDLDALTSDSSDADFLWQLNVPKTTSIPTLRGSKLKPTTPKQAKYPETRSLIPQPSARRQSTGAVLATPKNARRPLSGDERRKTGNAKLEK